MNKTNLKLLNLFANDHTLATNLDVTITENCKSFKPNQEVMGYARYEDANLLASLICGAESFIFYLERNGYKIKKETKWQAK